MTRHFYLIPLCFLLASCRVTLPYPASYSLTKENFSSRAGEFNGKVPLGWFVPNMDKLPISYLIWLIKDDYSAVFHISELNLDQMTEKQVKSSGLLLLAQISLSLRLGEKATTEAKPAEFKIDSRDYCSYEAGSDSSSERVVVFAANAKYYECVIKTIKGEWMSQELKNLFITQQTILSTLTFR